MSTRFLLLLVGSSWCSHASYIALLSSNAGMEPTFTNAHIDILDDEELALLWRSSEWIGRGKSFTDVPSYVLAAHQRELQLPESAQTILLAPDVPVSAFLAVQLPSQPSVLAYQKASSAFSYQDPTESIEAHRFDKRLIPPESYLKELAGLVGQAWLDGAQSIVDERYKHSRLPLHVLTYWQAMSQTISTCNAWNHGVTWAKKQLRRLHLPALEAEFFAALDSTPWNGEHCALGAVVATRHYARLLSHEWISGELIDILFADLQQRLPSNSDCAVETLTFSHSATSSFGRAENPQEPGTVLTRYTEHVKAGVLKRLYFPAHVNQNHWILFCVDFEKRTLAYGMRNILNRL